MARKADPDRTQAGGWRSEPGGEGASTHRRETMLVVFESGVRMALVMRVYADRIVTTTEEWRGTNR